MRFLLCCAMICLAFSVRAQSTQPSAVPDDVKAVLDQINAAYSTDKPMRLSGKISYDIDAGGTSEKHQIDFTLAYQSPAKFRHELKDDVLVVGTGEKVYAYLPSENQYVVVDAPKERADGKALGDSIMGLLRNQDPVLLMLMSKDPGAAIAEGGKDPVLEKDADGARTIAFTRDEIGYRVSVDASNGFVTAIQMDQSKWLKSRGVEDVKTALLTIKYELPEVDAKLDANAFDWKPPKDATLAKPEDEEPPGTEGDPVAVLTGKPAPDFELKTLDGKPFKLSDTKGSVTILDFWATWCGPCVASMPHLDALYNEMSEKGLKVYAVNLKETDKQVQKFITGKKLSLPVLMDTKGAVAGKYAVNGIPQTVVIGKDGVVSKVIIGFGGDDAELRAAVEEAMKKN